MRADLVLLSVGFSGPEVEVFGEQAPLQRDDGAIAVGRDYETSRPGVFACGDATRGASLVVWAIWEGREAARAVDISPAWSEPPAHRAQPSSGSECGGADGALAEASRARLRRNEWCVSS